jgi:adenylosuccinate lyase
MTGQPDHEHARGHIADSRFFGHLYATETTRRLFCDVCRMQRWLDVESALARCQAEIGLIPESAARRIVTDARIERLDLDRVASETRRTSHSLAALLSELERVCGSAGEFVHYGATTQDIQDTAQGLEMKAVLDDLQATLLRLASELAGVADRHKASLMIGRTHGQPALATTFGLKVAGWVDEILRHLERIGQSRPRVAAAQLAGGVGTMAAFGDRGPELLRRFASRLGLGTPGVCWHASRDRVAEFVGLLATVAGTFGRIANEVRALSRPELGELEVHWEPGRIGSTTMPHKRNPGHCEQIVALAALAAAHASTAIHAMLAEHERDARTLRTEWVTVADVSHAALAAAALVGELLEDCEALPEVMAANATDAADALSTEALMFALAGRVGKPRAFELVYGLSQGARDRHASLQDELAVSGALDAYLSDGELERLFDPRAQLGSAVELVDAVVARARDVVAAARAVSQDVPSTRRSASNGDSRRSCLTTSRRILPT